MGKSVSLVTGAAGFIGSHLAERLVADGGSVHVLVRPTTSLERLVGIERDLAIHRIDLADRAGLRACLRDIRPDRVFHLAAETRLAMEPGFAAARRAIGLYLEPTLNLVEALADLPDPPSVMIRAGTIAEYGLADLPFRENGPARPRTPYGAGMLATTSYLDMLAPALPFPVITARLALCYGPRQSRAFLVPALIDAVLAQRAFTVERPEDRRDLLHVSDAVDALLRLSERAPPDCTVVNVSSGTAPSMDEVARIVVELAGCDPGLVSLRRPLPGDRPVELRCAPDLARARFDWESRCGLAEGLARTLAAERCGHALAEDRP